MGSLVQECSTSSRFEAWLQKAEPYMRALIAWHNAEADRNLFFQSHWVLRGRVAPAAFLEECCEDGIPVPQSDELGCSFPSREACEFSHPEH